VPASLPSSCFKEILRLKLDLLHYCLLSVPVDVSACDVSAVLVYQNIVVDKLAIVVINGKLSIAIGSVWSC
jgi:hypothetical protein